MQRLCDRCHGVYRNNHSFKEHQRKTGHQQIVSNNDKPQNTVGDNKKICRLDDSLKAKKDLISSPKNSVETNDAEFNTFQRELKEAFAKAIADVSMLRPVVAKHFASLGEDSSFETTDAIFKPAINYLLDVSHKFGIIWNAPKAY